ncbi:hypothetical protein M422DRAFT_53109 [Sphaerobolus stellatus SS14]|uniref:HMG box domain-containing protein n=1 Tax=Sphaerobolus stellatus (strain SS14) TaxID=990650 RepID=A0A0C9V3M0_SPHS4|nr:hypothetical protein M422DRAFT_53109 [Sphaerobolus stellatus SS14]
MPPVRTYNNADTQADLRQRYHPAAPTSPQTPDHGTLSRNDIDRLRRPSNALLLFRNDLVEEFKADPENKIDLRDESAISRIASRRWGELSRFDKDTYYAMAAAENALTRIQDPNFKWRTGTLHTRPATEDPREVREKQKSQLNPELQWGLPVDAYLNAPLSSRKARLI